MNTLSFAYWGEGVSDERFLPRLIERVLHELLFQCAESQWEVFFVTIAPSPNEVHFIDQVFDLAEQAEGFGFLFVHTDADAKNENEKVWPNKWEPFFEKAKKENADILPVIPVIPVTKIENWKLADFDALIKVIGVEMTKEDASLNMPTQTLEGRANSKEILEGIIKLAKDRDWAAPNLNEIDEGLSEHVLIDKLNFMPSFQIFVKRLKKVLSEKNIIDDNCTALGT